MKDRNSQQLDNIAVPDATDNNLIKVNNKSYNNNIEIEENELLNIKYYINMNSLPQQQLVIDYKEKVKELVRGINIILFFCYLSIT